VIGISTPFMPAMMESAAGSLWVFTHHSTVVYQIDPNSNKVVRAINVGDTPCTLVAAGAGAVWLSNCGAGENSTGWIYGIDVRTDRVAHRVRGTFPGFGAGSLWVLDDSGKQVRRVDPRTGVVLATIATGSNQQPGGGTLGIGGVGYGSAWLTSDADKAVTRISTATNTVTAVIPLAGAQTLNEAFPNSGSGYIDGSQLAFAAGKAWYANPAGLFAIDATSNHVRLIRLHMQPFSQWGDTPVVAGAGSVWVRTTDATVDRIDPTSMRILATYRADRAGGGGGLAVAFGSLWVENAGSDSVWREPVRAG
jgi:streptogramin lyase